MKRSKQNKAVKRRPTPAGRALRRSARVARKTARAYGTLIYYWRDGKIVGEKP